MHAFPDMLHTEAFPTSGHAAVWTPAFVHHHEDAVTESSSREDMKGGFGGATNGFPAETKSGSGNFFMVTGNDPKEGAGGPDGLADSSKGDAPLQTNPPQPEIIAKTGMELRSPSSGTTTEGDSPSPSSWNVSESTPSVAAKPKATTGSGTGTHQPGLNPAAAPFQVPKAPTSVGSFHAAAGSGAGTGLDGGPMDTHHLHQHQMGCLGSGGMGLTNLPSLVGAGGGHAYSADFAMMSAANPNAFYGSNSPNGSVVHGSVSSPTHGTNAGTMMFQGFPHNITGGGLHGLKTDPHGGSFGYPNGAYRANAGANMAGGHGFVMDPRMLVTAAEMEDLQRVQLCRYRAKMLPRPLTIETHKEIWAMNNDYKSRKPANPIETRLPVQEKGGDKGTEEGVDPVDMGDAALAREDTKENTISLGLSGTTNPTSDILTADAGKTDSNVYSKDGTSEKTSDDDSTDSTASSGGNFDDEEDGVETPAERQLRLSAYRLLLERWTRHMKVLEAKPDVRGKILLPGRPCPTAEAVVAALTGKDSRRESDSSEEDDDEHPPSEEAILRTWSAACKAWWEEIQALQQQMAQQRRAAQNTINAANAAATAAAIKVSGAFTPAGGSFGPAMAATAPSPTKDQFTVTASDDFITAQNPSLAYPVLTIPTSFPAPDDGLFSNTASLAMSPMGTTSTTLPTAQPQVPHSLMSAAFGTTPTAYHPTLSAATAPLGNVCGMGAFDTVMSTSPLQNAFTGVHASGAKLTPIAQPIAPVGNSLLAPSAGLCQSIATATSATISANALASDDDLFVDDDELAQAYQQQLLKVIEEEE